MVPVCSETICHCPDFRLPFAASAGAAQYPATTNAKATFVSRRFTVACIQTLFSRTRCHQLTLTLLFLAIRNAYAKISERHLFLIGENLRRLLLLLAGQDSFMVLLQRAGMSVLYRPVNPTGSRTAPSLLP